MYSASYANDFLKRKKFIFLRCPNIWLFQLNLHFLQAIHSNYNCFGRCDNDLKTPSNRRVGKGGVALLWHRSLDHQVSPLDIGGVQYRVIQSLHFTFYKCMPYLQYFIDYL